MFYFVESVVIKGKVDENWSSLGKTTWPWPNTQLGFLACALVEI